MTEQEFDDLETVRVVALQRDYNKGRRTGRADVSAAGLTYGGAAIATMVFGRDDYLQYLDADGNQLGAFSNLEGTAAIDGTARPDVASAAPTGVLFRVVQGGNVSRNFESFDAIADRFGFDDANRLFGPNGEYWPIDLGMAAPRRRMRRALQEHGQIGLTFPHRDGLTVIAHNRNTAKPIPATGSTVDCAVRYLSAARRQSVLTRDLLSDIDAASLASVEIAAAAADLVARNLYSAAAAIGRAQRQSKTTGNQ
ncbi:hypothetical protein N9164_12560 [Draconibacterium sp.]|nr:hypothetical protein [Draconibacterium sp.]